MADNNTIEITIKAFADTKGIELTEQQIAKLAAEMRSGEIDGAGMVQKVKEIGEAAAGVKDTAEGMKDIADATKESAEANKDLDIIAQLSGAWAMGMKVNQFIMAAAEQMESLSTAARNFGASLAAEGDSLSNLLSTWGTIEQVESARATALANIAKAEASLKDLESGIQDQNLLAQYSGSAALAVEGLEQLVKTNKRYIESVDELLLKEKSRTYELTTQKGLLEGQVTIVNNIDKALADAAFKDLDPQNQVGVIEEKIRALKSKVEALFARNNETLTYGSGDAQDIGGSAEKLDGDAMVAAKQLAAEMLKLETQLASSEKAAVAAEKASEAARKKLEEQTVATKAGGDAAETAKPKLESFAKGIQAVSDAANEPPETTPTTKTDPFIESGGVAPETEYDAAGNVITAEGNTAGGYQRPAKSAAVTPTKTTGNKTGTGTAKAIESAAVETELDALKTEVSEALAAIASGIDDISAEVTAQSSIVNASNAAALTAITTAATSAISQMATSSSDAITGLASAVVAADAALAARLATAEGQIRWLANR